MKSVSATLLLSAIGLAFVIASPAEAAKSSKYNKVRVSHSIPRQHAAVAAETGFQGGVRRGPLYNGQDYIGDDPDPNIRAGLLKDMTRYQGSY